MTGPANGSLGAVSGNSVTYTPDTDWNGIDSFTFEAADSLAATGNTATVTIAVTGLNDPPTITGAPIATASTGAGYSFIPGGGDVDLPYGDSISYSIDVTPPTGLVFDTGDGSLSGTPTEAGIPVSGSGSFASFSITVTDNALATDTIGPFTITIADATPPDAPGGLSAVGEGGQILVSWSLPAAADLAGVMIRRDTAGYPADILAGTQVVDDTPAALTSVVDAALTDGVLYYYSAFAYDEAGNSAVAQIAAMPDVPTALYPNNGLNWNDYVVNDGADRYHATGAACDPATDGPGYDACIHGGEARVFDSNLADACAGLTAADLLGAFDWVCDDSGATTLFYSVGLKEGIYLSDLIDFVAPGWKDNQLIVTGGAGFTSSLRQWWANPIVVDNDGMAAAEAVAGTIYIVTADPGATYLIDASNVGLVVQPGVTMTGSGTINETLVSATSQNFLWLEGALDATGDSYGVYWISVKFSVMRGVSADNSNNQGVLLVTSSNNNTLSGISAANNGSAGVYLHTSSNNNTLSGINAANNSDGVVLDKSNNNSLSGISAANNGSSGVYLYTSLDNTLTGISTANNGSNGILLTASSNNNTLSDISATNNGAYGVYFNASNNTFTGLLKVGNNATKDCNVTGGPGLVDTTCANNGTSDATLSAGVTTTASFAGKVIVDDTINTSDDNGTDNLGPGLALYNNITDWTGFENYYRGWGLDGWAFPSDNNQGPCITALNCRIWDWRLAADDGGDPNGAGVGTPGAVLAGVNALPTGADYFSHTWFFDNNADGFADTPVSQNDCDNFTPAGAVFAVDNCTSTFLNNAVEISGDGFGNDNLLCESNEECLFSPNIGAYQGEGALVSAGAFTNGAITGVILWEYATNGVSWPVAANPLYPTNGSGWNDYVKNDGADTLNSTGAACTGAETGGYDACIHGGEYRAIPVTGYSSCTGLTATDLLGAFDWLCDGSVNPVEMVSTGLKTDKKLSDLIDWTSRNWRGNQITVNDGASDIYTSARTVWWNNPLVVDNNGMLAAEAVAGTIYLVTADPAATYLIDAPNVGLVVQPGVTMSGPGAVSDLISASSQNFLWLEGALDATGDDLSVSWSSVKFSVMRGVSADNGDFHGVYLASSTNNALTDISAANNGSVGVYLVNSSKNTLSGVSAANNGTNGVVMQSSSKNNTLTDIRAANNGNFGMYLQNSSNNNTLSGISVSNNFRGIEMGGSNNNIFSGITVSNNGQYGVILQGSLNNTFSGISTVNNGIDGLYFSVSLNNTLSDISAANNGGVAVTLSDSSNNYFTGLLKIGSNGGTCNVAGGTLPGLDITTCANNGASDATLTTGVTMAGSFIGKVLVDDVANASDVLGSATYPVEPATFDWTNFDTAYSGWGLEGGDFPISTNRGRWTGGAGHIWDWSLVTSDTGDVGGSVALEVLTLPTGDDTLTHTWSDASTITFLKNAVELLDDGFGNDNLLCESDEHCLFSPNIGAYQGHGALISAGAFTDGALTGITLWRYESNGY